MGNKNYLIFIGVCFELVGIEVALIYIGMAIDKKMVWQGYAVTAGAIIGLVSWLIHILILLKTTDNNAKGQ